MNNKPNTAFWIISIAALLWNLMGLFQFGLATVFMDSMTDSIAPAELEMMKNVPLWYTVAFGVSVFSGVLACILMLMKNKIAILLFLISLITVLISQGYWAFGTDAIDIIGMQAMIMPMIVIIISIFLYYYSKGAARNGWLK
ncbi:hypothetical protein ULMS_18500 [Patiriisocius marinistellae]|uniref:Sugar transporter n=1 Tax=Patiriisocius marinistellae TaxID=2494560 RepID=A0A5J4FYM6_9FLAO|nr:hypothetical protein [Patiriisocius marinistellae]GEQ86342.1 hypothetical protein ULMS_18500 [Patiriisocius marinistellae]